MQYLEITIQTTSRGIEAVASALKQIEEKQYEVDLIARGIPKENIYKYGFAFRGKEVLIGNGIE